AIRETWVMKRNVRGHHRDQGTDSRAALRRWGPAIMGIPMLVTVALLVGCADRAAGEGNEEGPRPERPEGSPDEGRGSFLYAACETVDDCGGLEYCLRPAGELGFCTQGCVAGEDGQCDLASEA